ncbi:MAG: MASE3 domain-containing protein [Acetivibrionales bacterium]
MRSYSNIRSFVNTNKHYFFLIAAFVFSLVLFKLASLFQDQFDKMMGGDAYLSWHTMFELSSILVSFSVFITSYYTYRQTKNLRLIFLGAVFLFMGLVDMFHTLSYKGMPAFFINDSCCANRATTFWIISRLVGSAGILIATLIPKNKESSINKFLFAGGSIVFSIFSFIVTTYYPDALPKMYIEGQGLTQSKIILEYVIVIFMVAAIIKLLNEYGKEKETAAILLAGGLLISVFSEFAFISYNDPYDIHNYIGHIYKVIAFYLIFRATFIVSVQKPYLQLSEAKNELKGYIENLDKLVHERTRQLREINRKLLDDLNYARDIQLSMLPQSMPELTEVSFAAAYFPAERVSGDFYNVFILDEEHIGFYIGDVSGHGVPAAMLTIFLKQSINSMHEMKEKREEIIYPSAILDNLYESFNKTNFKDEVYVVMLYGVLNIKTRVLTYSSAGLNKAPLLARSTGEVKEIEIEGFPICKLINLYNVAYKSHTLNLEKGDKLLLYTDGLVEVRNTCGEEFSEHHLRNILSSISGKTANEITDSITEEINKFMTVSELTDDITFLVMEVK